VALTTLQTTQELVTASMKSISPLVVGILISALCVLGYLYYQRTKNDITIQVPKVELKR
jgi:predicted negative regulator of RcsB-dependent stress response